MPNANLMTAGLAGFALGKIPLPHFNRLRVLWLSALLGYIGAYYFALSYGQTLVTQIASACLALATFYGAALHFGSHGAWQNRLLTLGRYTLVCYIGQIAILQVLARWMERPTPLSLEFFILFCLTLFLTELGAECVSAVRRTRVGDRVYQLIFLSVIVGCYMRETMVSLR
jgi:hypothetical protein